MKRVGFGIHTHMYEYFIFLGYDARACVCARRMYLSDVRPKLIAQEADLSELMKRYASVSRATTSGGVLCIYI